jgi:hypothetical protein
MSRAHQAQTHHVHTTSTRHEREHTSRAHHKPQTQHYQKSCHQHITHHKDTTRTPRVRSHHKLVTITSRSRAHTTSTTRARAHPNISRPQTYHRHTSRTHYCTNMFQMRTCHDTNTPTIRIRVRIRILSSFHTPSPLHAPPLARALSQCLPLTLSPSHSHVSLLCHRILPSHSTVSKVRVMVKVRIRIGVKDSVRIRTIFGRIDVNWNFWGTNCGLPSRSLQKKNFTAPQNRSFLMALKTALSRVFKSTPRVCAPPSVKFRSTQNYGKNLYICL